MLFDTSVESFLTSAVDEVLQPLCIGIPGYLILRGLHSATTPATCSAGRRADAHTMPPPEDDVRPVPVPEDDVRPMRPRTTCTPCARGRRAPHARGRHAPHACPRHRASAGGSAPAGSSTGWQQRLCDGSMVHGGRAVAVAGRVSGSTCGQGWLHAGLRQHGWQHGAGAMCTVYGTKV
jgi:hypothetical protein